VLKVFLFGSSVLDENVRGVDPKCIPIKLGIRKVTPGMIAFAAILVSVFPSFLSNVTKYHP
jgi:hypothetical protein